MAPNCQTEDARVGSDAHAANSWQCRLARLRNWRLRIAGWRPYLMQESRPHGDATLLVSEWRARRRVGSRRVEVDVVAGGVAGWRLVPANNRYTRGSASGESRHDSLYAQGGEEPEGRPGDDGTTVDGTGRPRRAGSAGRCGAMGVHCAGASTTATVRRHGAGRSAPAKPQRPRARTRIALT